MTELLREVNRSIRDLAAIVDQNDAETWEFVCECGEEGCTARFSLPLSRYDELEHSGAALLAPGHPLRLSESRGR